MFFVVFFYHIYILGVYFTSFSAAISFIMEDFNNCLYNASDGRNTSFNSKVWMVENYDVIIYYTLCGYVPLNVNCGQNVTACLKNKQDESIQIIGNKFIVDKEDNFPSMFSLKSYGISDSQHVDKKTFKLSITFQCSKETKLPHLQKLNDFEYDVQNMLPPNCHLPCTARIYGDVLDIRPLKHYFFITSEERNFSITLCGANEFCKEPDVSICEVLKNNWTIPLSKTSTEMLSFNHDDNVVRIRGSYSPTNNQSDRKDIELNIKCNWRNIGLSTLTGPIIKYIPKVPKQGKHYQFEMESIYGCVKLPSSCVIEDTLFIYNLTRLYNTNGYYTVSDVPNGSMYLNICGPLYFEYEDNENMCARTFSQVCELGKELYINRGSIFTKFIKEDDVIKTTVTNGGICTENSTRQYSTHISMICSKTEEGPKFNMSEGCDIFINWNTPHACPLQNEAICKNMHEHDESCVVKFQGNMLDLGALTLNRSNYEVEDPRNKDVKYLLNVCGPATDPEVPCMKDSMILMKNLNEINLKNRYKSLGKMKEIIASNGKVVINTLSGSYCGEEGDYSSVINFICSSKQEGPRFVNSTKCEFQFEWKTPRVCVQENQTPAKPAETQRKDNPTISTINISTCLFQEIAKNISINFGDMKKTALKIDKANKEYIFEICDHYSNKDSYSECVKEKCWPYQLQKKLITRNSDTYIEIKLQKRCEPRSDFNRLLFKLVCDEHNEHFKLGEIDNCTFTIDLSTSLICSAQVKVPAKEAINKKKLEQYEVVTRQIARKPENCSVSHNGTDYKFYIDNLQLNVPSLECPKVDFNYKKSSVTLTYSDSICNETKESGTKYYTIVLLCSKTDVKEIKKTNCSHVLSAKPEFCKQLFQEVMNNSVESSNIGVIIASIFGVLLVLGTSTFFYIRRHRGFIKISNSHRAYESLEDKNL